MATSAKSASAIDVCPFKVVIDSNESAPFPFMGIKSREHKDRDLVIECVRKPLWNFEPRDIEIKGGVHRVGFADYSIEGYERAIAIERKSIPDLFGTLGSRRERFEAEIRRLSEDCEFACVIVEGDWPQIMTWRGHGPDPKSIHGTINAWRQRYRGCHWELCPTRAFAERQAFRILERFWLDRNEK